MGKNVYISATFSTVSEDKKQCILDRWSIRELRRQKDSALFHRIALSKENKRTVEEESTVEVIPAGANAPERRLGTRGCK